MDMLLLKTKVYICKGYSKLNPKRWQFYSLIKIVQNINNELNSFKMDSHGTLKHTIINWYNLTKKFRL